MDSVPHGNPGPKSRNDRAHDGGGPGQLDGSATGKPEEYEAAKSAGYPATLLEWVQEHAAPLLYNIGKMLPKVVENQKIGDAIIRMKWSSFDVSSASHTLLTSDRPFVMTHGLADTRCVIGGDSVEPEGKQVGAVVATVRVLRYLIQLTAPWA